MDTCKLCGRGIERNVSMNGPSFGYHVTYYECGSSVDDGDGPGKLRFRPACKGKPHLICAELAAQLLEALPEKHPLKLSLPLIELASEVANQTSEPS